jgi:hypothetical protein
LIHSGETVKLDAARGGVDAVQLEALRQFTQGVELVQRVLLVLKEAVFRIRIRTDILGSLGSGYSSRTLAKILFLHFPFDNNFSTETMFQNLLPVLIRYCTFGTSLKKRERTVPTLMTEILKRRLHKGVGIRS